jgi:hypothetical protein
MQAPRTGSAVFIRFRIGLRDVGLFDFEVRQYFFQSGAVYRVRRAVFKSGKPASADL